jgi:DNA-binding NarL/FixJ family response regulator
MSKIHVAIVEDDADLREAFQLAIEANADFDLVGVYGDAESFVKSFPSILLLDVVLMDINLPGITGIQCIESLKPKREEVQYLVCTIFEDNENLFNALCAGATGYILKSAREEELYRAIREINGGGSPMSPQIARMLVRAVPKKKTNQTLLDLLTPREREILDLLAAGYRYKEISEKLFLGIETVRTYIRNIYSKLQVHSRTDAVNKLFER